MEIPILTPELVFRLEDCDTNFIRVRLEALQKIEGNPFGAEVKTFGRTTGLAVRSMASNTLFNRAAGFAPADLDRLDEILEWFAETNLSGRFDLLPGHTSPELFKTLAGRGFNHSGFYAVLYALPQVEPANFSGVTVREVQVADLETFYDVYMGGFGFPAERREVLTRSLTGLHGDPTVKFYLAYVDGQPAAMALLLTHDSIGYLATATTLANFRGKGCQKALVHRRIVDAARLGCELVTSQANFGSLSQGNMEKMGFRLAYTKAVWTRNQ